MGWSKFLHRFLSGGDRPVQDPSLGGGFFGTGSVGGGWQDYLKGLYATDTPNTGIYRSQSTALRDALAQESQGQEDQFSQATNQGGFYDSGARLQGLNDINRNRMMSYSQGLTQILTNLENQKMQAAYPFLQAQIGGFEAYQGAKLGEEQAGNFRANAHAQAVIGGFSAGSKFGGGGGGG